MRLCVDKQVLGLDVSMAHLHAVDVCQRPTHLHTQQTTTREEFVCCMTAIATEEAGQCMLDCAIPMCAYTCHIKPMQSVMSLRYATRGWQL